MSADHPQIVIVRRRNALEEAHHGGAWKIAFADFMTAMMAFFLVLWIISATDKNTKTIIARYFNPVKVEEPARAQKGIHGGALDPNAAAKPLPRGADKPHSEEGETADKPPSEAGEATPKAADSRHRAEVAPSDPAAPMPTMSEDELFDDPRASLDRIVGAPPPQPSADPTSAPQPSFGDVGPSSDESFRDPFRPLGGGKATYAAAKAGRGPQEDSPRDERSATLSEPPQDVPQQRPSKTEAPKPSPAIEGAKAPPGTAPMPTKSGAAPAGDAGTPPPDATRAHAAALLAELKNRLGPEAPTTPGPQLDVQATDEGILISLTDRKTFSMFAIGSAEPQPRVVRMMDAIAASLKSMPGAIVVRGHTDAHPYHSARYDNWRLSSARAQMAYYMLNRAGIREKRFERIEGFADHRLKDPAKPFAAENRRIEILLRESKP
jgi:chemotaxis protein MotB